MLSENESATRDVDAFHVNYTINIVKVSVTCKYLLLIEGNDATRIVTGEIRKMSTWRVSDASITDTKMIRTNLIARLPEKFAG